MKAVIAGAGIGGLTAACCLARAGVEVEICEQAPELGEVGAGIQISPNAARVLHHIGAFEEVRAAAARPEAYRFRLFDSGEVLQQIPFGDAFEARHGLPYLTVHRADLLSALIRALQRLAPGSLRLGAAATGLRQDDTGAALALEGGEARGDVVIGADGVRSALRAGIMGETEARYTGQAAWRIAVPAAELAPEPAPDTVDIWVGPGRHAVTYPLRRGEVVNMVAGVRHDAWEEESWTAARPWEELVADFPGWHPFIHRLIEVADRKACYRWALFDRDPVETWANGRAVVIGDAAHATLPYMAQGAAMAMEDGAVLARALTAFPVEEALARFTAARVERTSRVVLESRANARLFQMPTTEALRENFARRDMNAERNAWLFSYDALSAPL